MYGWERPLYFGKTAEPKLRFDKPDWFANVAAEVEAAHQRAAIFDASSFGKIDVTGPDAEAFLLHVCAGQMARAPGSVIYTAVLNERGTFESDITAQRIAEDHYRLFVGTAAIKRDMAWFLRHGEGYDVSICDTTEEHATFGLMGPEAAKTASAVGAESLTQINYFKHGEATIAGHHIRAARLSYVGEAGWEITCRAAHAQDVYRALTQAGAAPAGLYAQTSMRIEKGFCAMGHELDSDVTPLDVGLGFALRKSGGYIGAEAIEEKRKTSTTHQVVSLILDDPDAVPLGHEPVYSGDQIIGHTTSCAFGYRVGRPVALAFCKAGFVGGDQVEVNIAGQKFTATVHLGALFDPKGGRMRSMDE